MFKKTVLSGLIMLSALASAKAAEDISIETYDGVKLRGAYYPATGGKNNNACILMLHPYQKDYTKVKAWSDLADKLSKEGFHVITFDFRFHGGKTMDVIPDIFWKDKVNQKEISGANKKPLKNEVALKDIKNPKDYYPMLVNDIMAVRTYLDSLNDQGKVNTSSVYLIGVGDAVSLGFMYMVSEWQREREVPNVPLPPSIISTNRNLFPGSQPCGRDMAGAVFISPTRNTAVTANQLEKYFNSKNAEQLRTETPMLFLNGDKDTKGKEGSKFFFDKVLVANPKSGSSLQKLTLTYHVEIKDSKATDAELLTAGETEQKVKDFINTISADRKNKAAIPNRKYTKPLPVNLQSFGFNL